MFLTGCKKPILILTSVLKLGFLVLSPINICFFPILGGLNNMNLTFFLHLKCYFTQISSLYVSSFLFFSRLSLILSTAFKFNNVFTFEHIRDILGNSALFSYILFFRILLTHLVLKKLLTLLCCF